MREVDTGTVHSLRLHIIPIGIIDVSDGLYMLRNDLAAQCYPIIANQSTTIRSHVLSGYSASIVLIVQPDIVASGYSPHINKRDMR